MFVLGIFFTHKRITGSWRGRLWIALDSVCLYGINAILKIPNLITMVRKLLLCASFLFGMYAAGVNAQSIRKIQTQTQTTKTASADDGIIRVGGIAKSETAPAAPAAKTGIQIKDNELWWGYYSGKYSFDPEDMRRWGVGGNEGDTTTCWFSMRTLLST